MTAEVRPELVRRVLGPSEVVWVRAGWCERLLPSPGWLAFAVETGVLRDSVSRRIRVLRLPCGSEIIEKSYRVRGRWRAGVKRLLRREPSGCEARAGLRFESGGFAGPKVLAFGRRYRNGISESFIVHEFWPRARSGDRVLRPTTPLRGAPPSGVGRLASSFGEQMGRMHRAGAYHEDPHPGNLLLSADRVVLIDLRRLRYRRPTRWRARRHLALLFQALGRRISPSEQLRFLRSYAPELSPAQRRALFRVLGQMGWRRSRRFEHHRIRAAWKDRPPFRRLAEGSLRWHIKEEAECSELREIMADPEAPFDSPASESLKAGRSTTVVRVQDWVVKRYNDRRASRRLLDRLRLSRARSSFMRAWLLERCELSALRCVAVGEQRRLGLVRRRYLVSRYLPNLGALEISLNAGTAERRRALLAQCARLAASLHVLGLGHRDLKAGNLLVDREGEVVLIDLDGLRRRPFLSLARRRFEVERLCSDLERWAAVSKSERSFLIRSYDCEWARLHPWCGEDPS